MKIKLNNEWAMQHVDMAAVPIRLFSQLNRPLSVVSPSREMHLMDSGVHSHH